MWDQRGYRQRCRIRVRLSAVALFALCLPIGFDRLGVAGASPSAGFIQPRIFNGIITFEYPFAGLLLERRDTGSTWLSHCTLSLIGPSTALTAAHCLCDAHGSLCQPGKRYAPQLGRYRVLLQNAGLLEIASVAIPSGFNFPDQDFAVIVLTEPASGLATATLASESTALGTTGRIVGFGNTSAYQITTGIKRVGTVVTDACGDDLDGEAFVCWTSDGGLDGANTCPGDSGGPLMVQNQSGQQVLAGVASGGYGACDGEDLAFDTAVVAHLAAIESMADAGGAGASSGETIAEARVLQGRLSGAVPELLLSIEVPPGSSRLVAVGNGEDSDGNDYLLRVVWGDSPGQESSVCTSDLPGVFEACTIDAPEPGTWTVAYLHDFGLGGEVQVSVTAFRQDCSIDVDGNGQFDALTDGLLVLRYLAGRSGGDLTEQVVGDGATRTEAQAIADFLNSQACLGALDVDQDGMRQPDTDGLLILRHLFGFAGAVLIQDALSPTARRTDPVSITVALDALMR